MSINTNKAVEIFVDGLVRAIEEKYVSEPNDEDNERWKDDFVKSQLKIIAQKIVASL